MRAVVGRVVIVEAAAVCGLGAGLEESAAKALGPGLCPIKVLAEVTAIAICNSRSRSPSNLLPIGEIEAGSPGRLRRRGEAGPRRP